MPAITGRNLQEILGKSFQAQAAFVDELLGQPASQVKFQLARQFLTASVEDYYGYHPYITANFFPKLMNLLFDHDELDYATFRDMGLSHIRALHMCFGYRFNAWSTRYHLPVEANTHFTAKRYQVLLSYANDLAWELAQNLTERNCDILMSIPQLNGERFLLLAAKYVSEDGSDKLSVQSQWDSIKHIYIHLARTEGVDTSPEATRQKLIQQLRQFPEQTLKTLLPVAPYAYRTLCTALNWGVAEPLIAEIYAIGSKVYPRGRFLYHDLSSVDDPTCGVLDIESAKKVLVEAGAELAKTILKSFNDAQGMINTVFLLQAVADWNREAVEKGIKNHKQIAIKGYGLLPIYGGEHEVLERFLTLKESAKAAHKFGAQRRVSHAVAVEVGLRNLAQTAGYDSLERLEWEMEAQLAQETASDRTWKLEDYELHLEIEDLDAKAVVHKSGKALKSIPKPVRSSPEYQEAKDAIAQHRNQVRRVRKGLLEHALTTGESFKPEDLQKIIRLPAARLMLEKMVLRNEEGFFGLLDSEAFSLQGLSEQSQPIQSAVIIAHPYHLYQAHVLANWQREIIHRRIVQPIKQVFRELYLLTPAERESGTVSNRFAGHLLDGAVAGRLLGARDWRGESFGYTFVLPHKRFPSLRAVFEINFYHYLGGELMDPSGSIFFEPYPNNPNGNLRLPLEEIPPLIFSEVMRDVDLVVSVAGRDGTVHNSHEVYERRSELVTALLNDLGLLGVEIEGHFAHVKGKLANYRVHLGSAAIHIEPGNYLCIVPDRWGSQHDKLFLPFADESDTRTSEVISKILLLLNDDKIKDESILRQIRQRNLIL